jgi:hypothetical protein
MVPVAVNVATSLAVLEDAVVRSQTENVYTPEVLAALDFLEAQTDARWPFEQFRRVLAPREGELEAENISLKNRPPIRVEQVDYAKLARARSPLSKLTRGKAE